MLVRFSLISLHFEVKKLKELFVVYVLQLHILPKQVLGKSTFALSMFLLKWFPVQVVDRFLLFCSRLVVGDTKRIGIERPKIGPLQLKISFGKTPVLDDGAFAKIKSGDIKVLLYTFITS